MHTLDARRTIRKLDVLFSLNSALLEIREILI